MTSAPHYDIFQAIADPTRRKILRLLSNHEEMNLTRICKHFPISRPAVSKHLRILIDVGLVKEKKVGRETRYWFEPEPLLELKQWLSFYEQFWENNITMLKRYVEDEEINEMNISISKHNDKDKEWLS
jgi:DNA-binding transcriptional ArsR family regulator